MYVLQEWARKAADVLPSAIRIVGSDQDIPIKKPNAREMQHIVCRLHIALGFIFSGKPGKHYRCLPPDQLPVLVPQLLASQDDWSSEDDSDDEAPSCKREAPSCKRDDSDDEAPSLRV